MDERLLEKINEKIKEVLDQEINSNNLEFLYKLRKIKHYIKEDENMYGNYGGRRPGYDSYGRDSYGNYGNYGEGSYGRRGYDKKYRGDDHLDRAYNEYGRYEESRERYGANENTMKSLEYMLHSLEDFARYLKEDAQSPQEVEMIRQTAQRIAQM